MCDEPELSGKARTRFLRVAMSYISAPGHTRRLPIVVALALCAVPTAFWIVALYIGMLRPGGSCSFCVGYAGGEQGVLNCAWYGNGFVLFQYFPNDVSRHHGLYAKLSELASPYEISWDLILPHRGSTRHSEYILVHNLLPIVAGSLVAAIAIIVPRVRQCARRRRGLCVCCGYDLRGAVTQVCSECGFVDSGT